MVETKVEFRVPTAMVTKYNYAVMFTIDGATTPEEAWHMLAQMLDKYKPKGVRALDVVKL